MDEDKTPAHLRRFNREGVNANIPGPNVMDYAPTFLNTLHNIGPKLESIWFVYGFDNQEYPVAIFQTADACLRWLSESGGMHMGYSVVEWPLNKPEFKDVKCE